MNIGDKVRALHEDVEGFITKFLPNGIIEVEIEDGFEIPIHKNELVLVAAQEEAYFERGDVDKVDVKKTVKSVSEKGLYLIFEPLQGDKLVKMKFYNNTSHSILFSLYEKTFETFNKGFAGELTSKEVAEGNVLMLEDFENWPSFIFQFNLMPNRTDVLPRVKQKEIKMKASVFFKSKTDETPIGNPGWSFQIDQAEVKVDPDKLKDSLQTSSQPIKEAIEADAEVDLHADTLGLDSTIPKSEFLNHQLLAFEKALDNAIHASLPEVTFIHGVGNGKLQFEIQKKLSQHPNVATFTDARKEKFGYGATKASLK